MSIVVIILSSLALLAVIGNLGFTLCERKRNQKRNTALMQYVDAEVGKVICRLEKLEKGVVPDFEKAKEAANAVNDFNAGITRILGYDPYSALQEQRENARGGEVR